MSNPSPLSPQIRAIMERMTPMADSTAGKAPLSASGYDRVLDSRNGETPTSDREYAEMAARLAKETHTAERLKREGLGRDIDVLAKLTGASTNGSTMAGPILEPLVSRAHARAEPPQDVTPNQGLSGETSDGTSCSAPAPAGDDEPILEPLASSSSKERAVDTNGSKKPDETPVTSPVCRSVAAEDEAERQAELRRDIDPFARSQMPFLADMTGQYWQLYDNRAQIAAFNADVRANNRRNSAGAYVRTTQSHFVMKFAFSTLDAEGEMYAGTRFINFQNPYFFRPNFSKFAIHPDYHAAYYEDWRKLALSANRTAHAARQVMLGHFERDIREVTKGKLTGSARHPYNFAILDWDDDYPRIVVCQGYSPEVAFTMAFKPGRNPTSAQFEYEAPWSRWPEKKKPSDK